LAALVFVPVIVIVIITMPSVAEDLGGGFGETERMPPDVQKRELELTLMLAEALGPCV
jgi:hypothetical protein